ncbi:hypothetical protein NDU88_002238 [Pleurodeles waltl]|uniref:Uncharacterized protein n=1 Tax=Pleurodeles waltl TaxID=8319 RepID=A0AAV7U9W9_PLEWA|nr:hypothetical protein NDU88_002238 [Pleurodeles waltl]
MRAASGTRCCASPLVDAFVSRQGQHEVLNQSSESGGRTRGSWVRPGFYAKTPGGRNTVGEEGGDETPSEEEREEDAKTRTEGTEEQKIEETTATAT